MKPKTMTAAFMASRVAREDFRKDSTKALADARQIREAFRQYATNIGLNKKRK
jgi:hypothetical protein